jgi:predicted tellurium resistance membrane protein TerC
MKRILSAWIALSLALAAHAQGPVVEPPVESNTVGTIIFGVLFVGFCIGFVWMIWRNRDKDKKE